MDEQTDQQEVSHEQLKKLALKIYHAIEQSLDGTSKIPAGVLASSVNYLKLSGYTVEAEPRDPFQFLRDVKLDSEDEQTDELLGEIKLPFPITK